ncbi:MAG TPA: Hsp70 family protein, partial [Candidatus Gracilibacteria bacterium]|nr:Hsp70 family protein [Candidatus Gracilibacteria bacterium]
HITITGSSNLTDAEIEKMKKEAETHAEEDRKKKEAIEMRNKADSLVTQSERTLKDAGDKVSDDVKKPVQEKIDTLKKILEDKEAKSEDLEKGYKELSDEIQKVGAAMYQNAGAAGTDGATPPPQGEATPDDDGVKVYKKGEKEDVVEGEVVDDKKDEK